MPSPGYYKVDMSRPLSKEDLEMIDREVKKSRVKGRVPGFKKSDVRKVRLEK